MSSLLLQQLSQAYENKANQPLFWLIIVLSLFTAVISNRKVPQKYPKVPWLKISNLPGAAGEAEDVAAYVRNGSKVLAIGYEKVLAFRFRRRTCAKIYEVYQTWQDVHDANA